MSTQYKVWVDIEVYPDGFDGDPDKDMSEAVSFAIREASAYDTDREDEALTVAAIMTRLGGMVPDLLDLYSNRPNHPDDNAGLREFLYYDNAVADWREEFLALVMPTLTDEERK